MKFSSLEDRRQRSRNVHQRRTPAPTCGRRRREPSWHRHAHGEPAAGRLLVKANTLTTSRAAGLGYFYDPSQNTVDVYGEGVTLSGIDFGSMEVYITGSNDTIKNSTFEPANGGNWYSVLQDGTGSATIENSTFTGPKYSMSYAFSDFIGGNQLTIKNNSFIDAPADAIHILNGVVTGNYFSGGGYLDYSLGHPDAIWVTGTTKSVSITNNFIDWTTSNDAAIDAQHANGTTYTNNAIRITGEGGNANNITVSGNYLLGGGYTTQIGMEANGTLTNVNFTGNYIGFSTYGAYFPGSSSIGNISGNTIFDWSNPNYSSSAWASYLAAGVSTPNLVVSTGGGILNTSTQATTLYGAGYSQVVLYGNTSIAETNYVGGYGAKPCHGRRRQHPHRTGDLRFLDRERRRQCRRLRCVQGRYRPQPDRRRPDDCGDTEFHLHRHSSIQRHGRASSLPISGGTTTVQAKLAGNSSADLTMTSPARFRLRPPISP